MGIDTSVAWDKIRALSESVVAALPNLLIAVGAFILFFLIAVGIRRLVRTLADRHRRAYNLGIVLGRLSQGVVILIGALVALSIIFPSFKAGDLIQLLGITSVAIGFAFRDIFQNFLAGIILLLTEPFRIGDQIVVGGFEGTVEDIQTRATTIKTYDGRRVVIPNADLFTDSVTVNTAFDNRRSQYDVGIGYGDDIEKAKSLILEAVRGVEGVLDDPPPAVWVVELDASSVNLRVWWWIDPPQRANLFEVQDRVLTVIKNTLTENGIDLPFPTQQILFHDQTEETDGDRARQREGWPAGRDSPPAPLRIAGALRKLVETQAKQNGSPGR